MCVCACATGWAFTFYFTVKAVSILLRCWLLVGFLVILLGTLIIVVHPLNCVLLERKTIKGIIQNFNVSTKRLFTTHIFFAFTHVSI